MKRKIYTYLLLIFAITSFVLSLCFFFGITIKDGIEDIFFGLTQVFMGLTLFMNSKEYDMGPLRELCSSKDGEKRGPLIYVCIIFGLVLIITGIVKLIL